MSRKVKVGRRLLWMAFIPWVLGMASCATQANVVDLELEQERLKLRQSQLQEKMATIERLSESGSAGGQLDATDVVIRLDQLSAELQSLQGRVEETTYLTSEMSQRVDDFSFRTKELTDRLDILDRQMMLLEESLGRLSKSGVTRELPGQGSETPSGDSQPPEDSPFVLPGKSKGGSPSSSLSPSEAYGLAYNDYLKGNYELALNGFKNFLIQYKDTSLAPNAQYWIGESYYGGKEYRKAIEAFSKVVSDYPVSSKVPGSLLKTGFAYIQLADKEKARSFLKKVIEDFPFSDEANLAKSRLAELN
jgi:tol-pal system protein YbgF